ncbi:NUDIX domain-containing protein [Spirobacillus cienkowskii]|jgi:8-oxo-dGTP pyrophosphatase MutT (NUDIX family)|uniref:NUDIX domain-containing protein n=1 Tax=Spirobacillus cienkowskii TaxID=495820 RepID=A0A369KWZ6_9BACT|nr:MAG: NUDIX domain-containing protein [Spirobacillus cienkowskii]
MKNLFFFVFNYIKKIYQLFFNIRTFGVRAIIVNNDQVLLIKHTYYPGWHFPGGAVDKGESPRQAIIREVFEEVGVLVKEQPIVFDNYFHQIHRVDDIVILYVIKNYELVLSKCSEVKDLKWFNINDLPNDISHATKRRIDEYYFHHTKSDFW